jgi:hydrogenase maturation protease
MTLKKMKTLILGMGNPILSDDGVGLFVAKSLQNRVQGADIASSALVGMNLLDTVLGYETLFVIDAMTSPSESGNGGIGRLKRFSAEDRFGTLHLFSSHGMNIFDLLEFGKQCGFQVPRLEAVYGIEIESEVAFGEELSSELQEKLPEVMEAIMADLNSVLPTLSGRRAQGSREQALKGQGI